MTDKKQFEEGLGLTCPEIPAALSALGWLAAQRTSKGRIRGDDSAEKGAAMTDKDRP
jgi:hypothetical protein